MRKTGSKLWVTMLFVATSALALSPATPPAMDERFWLDLSAAKAPQVDLGQASARNPLPASAILIPCPTEPVESCQECTIPSFPPIQSTRSCFFFCDNGTPRVHCGSCGEAC